MEKERVVKHLGLKKTSNVNLYKKVTSCGEVYFCFSAKWIVIQTPFNIFNAKLNELSIREMDYNFIISNGEDEIFIPKEYNA